LQLETPVHVGQEASEARNTLSYQTTQVNGAHPLVCVVSLYLQVPAQQWHSD